MSDAPVHVVWHRRTVERPRGKVLWFTGLSGSGKSTVANEVEKRLADRGVLTYLLDGDNLRHGINASPALLKEEFGEEHAQRFGLGFGEIDRRENIRRGGEVAELFCAAGFTVLAAFVSPYRRDRDAVRRRIEGQGSAGDFVEIFVDASLATCESRDPKGLYKKARAGEISGFTGIDAPYEAPERAEIRLAASDHAPGALADEVIRYLDDAKSAT